ncbi:hypothetical protein F0562_006210 [Nyssa sinensis]|uniref:Uncharacterized protein n=1 Tax=Nyssa sinensis TaxID=561372 RepID=A0A5J5APV4_9ASTE|nr:hypothetical protein F0562_006210 [Nyssa sinensis]
MLSLTPFHFIVLRCFKISSNLRHALQRTFGFFRCFCWWVEGNNFELSFLFLSFLCFQSTLTQHLLTLGLGLFTYLFLIPDDFGFSPKPATACQLDTLFGALENFL